MNNLTALLATALLAAAAGAAQARDVGPDQALKLRDAGTIQPFDKLNAAALARHPGATLGETELDEEGGRYVYQVELHDSRGGAWDVALDAGSGRILKDTWDN